MNFMQEEAEAEEEDCTIKEVVELRKRRNIVGDPGTEEQIVIECKHQDIVNDHAWI